MCTLYDLGIYTSDIGKSLKQSFDVSLIAKGIEYGIENRASWY